MGLGSVFGGRLGEFCFGGWRRVRRTSKGGERKVREVFRRLLLGYWEGGGGYLEGMVRFGFE